MKQSKLLKIMGIIMTIFGFLSTLSNIFSVALVMLSSKSELNSMYTSYTNMYISSIFAIALSIILTIIGIMGTINYNKPEKAKICIIAGLIHVILLTISNIFTIFATNGSLTAIIVFSIISYIIPILYLVGAFQLKKMID